MPFAKTEVYQMDRRQLLKKTGTMGIAVGAAFVVPEQLLAQGLCEKLVLDNGEFKADQSGATLQFWIDGIHFGPRSELKSRANITLYMPLPQTATGYVESVVLMNPDRITIGARYFDVSMHTIDKRVPYVRFENIELDGTKDYYCVYTVRIGSTVKLYVSTINTVDPDTKKRLAGPTLSTLNAHFLPASMRGHFSTFLVGNTANPTPGLVTTQFQYYTQNGLENHCARGRVKDINSATGDFSIDIDYMHGDVDNTHYMRYFIVMDPVGRLLGWVYRSSMSDNTHAGSPGSFATVNRTTPEAIEAAGGVAAQFADIRDCPYIQFYTEDSYDAIARNMIRLR